LPFAGFVINGTLGRRLPKALVTTIALLAPLGSFLVVLGESFGVSSASFPVTETLPFPWISAGKLRIDFSFVFDNSL